jgi:hypothetical protein
MSETSEWNSRQNQSRKRHLLLFGGVKAGKLNEPPLNNKHTPSNLFIFDFKSNEVALNNINYQICLSLIPPVFLF